MLYNYDLIDKILLKCIESRKIRQVYEWRFVNLKQSQMCEQMIFFFFLFFTILIWRISRLRIVLENTAWVFMERKTAIVQEYCENYMGIATEQLQGSLLVAVKYISINKLRFLSDS